jgi:hypothetical protein
MTKHGKSWHRSALLALLASLGLVVFASAQPENQALPKPLPPEIVKAWRDAGFDVGWMKDTPPVSPAWGLWTPWREKAEAGAIPALDGHLDDVTAKLPDPGVAFGLDFHCGGYATDAPLKELSRFKNLQSLNIGAVRSTKRKTQIDLKDLSGTTTLRALYLFYLPVTDAQLKHVAGLKNLQVLDLSATRVTDAGLKELAGLTNLRWLNLSTIGVTAKGIAELQKDLPKCKIVTFDD